MQLFTYFEKADLLRHDLFYIHQRAISNGFATKEVDALFKKLDGNLVSIKKAGMKIAGYAAGDQFKYAKPPKVQANTNVTETSLKTELAGALKMFNDYRDDLLSRKAVITNPLNNSNSKVPSAQVGQFKKGIANIEALMELF